jgi:hypothetical protein
MRRLHPLTRSLASALLGLGLAGGSSAAHAAASAGAAGLSCPPSPGVISQLALGGLMLAVTATVHLLLTTVLVEVIRAPGVEVWCKNRQERRMLTTLLGAGAVALTILLEIALWALLLRQLSVFPNFESSLFFSGITFTSVGFGDQNLPTCWRLLGVAEAVNGLLIAGWSTAILVALVQRMMELRLGNHHSRE